MPLQDRQVLKIFLHSSGNHSKPVLVMDQYELDNWVFMGLPPDKYNIGALYDKFLTGKFVKQVSPNTYSQEKQHFKIILSNFTPDELKLFEEVWKERLAHFKKNPLKGKRIYRVTLTNTGPRPQATAESEITEKSGPFGDASLKPRNLLKSLEEILIHVPHDMVKLDVSDPLQVTITGHKAFSDIVFEGFGPDEMKEMVEYVKSFFAMQKSSNPIADKYIILEDVDDGIVTGDAHYDALEFISGQKREDYLFDALSWRTSVGGPRLPVIQKAPDKYASVGKCATNAILINFEPDELLRIQEVFKRWQGKVRAIDKVTKKNPLLEKKITSQLYDPVGGSLAYTDEHTVFSEEGINLFYAAKKTGVKVGARQLLEAIAENKYAFDAKYSYFRPTDRPDQFNLSNKKTDGIYLIRFHGFAPDELRDIARWASKGIKKSRIDKGQGYEKWVDEETGRGPRGSWRRNPLEGGYYTIIKEYRDEETGKVLESSSDRWDVRNDESAQVVVDAMNLGKGIERVEGMKIYLKGPMRKVHDELLGGAVGMYYVVDLSQSNLDPDFIKDVLYAADVLSKIKKESNPLLEPTFRVIYQWRRHDGQVEDEGVWAELTPSSVPRLFVDNEGQVAKLLSEFYGQLMDVEGRMLVFRGRKPLDSSRLQGTKIPVHRYYLVTLKDFDPFRAESFLQFARRALGKPMRNPIQEPYVIFKSGDKYRKERKVTMQEVISLNNSKISWASKKHTPYEEIIEFINYYGDVTGVEGLKVFFQTEMGTKYILDLAPLEDPNLVNQVLSRLSWAPKKNPEAEKSVQDIISNFINMTNRAVKESNFFDSKTATEIKNPSKLVHQINEKLFLVDPFELPGPQEFEKDVLKNSSFPFSSFGIVYNPPIRDRSADYLATNVVGLDLHGLYINEKNEFFYGLMVGVPTTIPNPGLFSFRFNKEVLYKPDSFDLSRVDLEIINVIRGFLALIHSSVNYGISDIKASATFKLNDQKSYKEFRKVVAIRKPRSEYLSDKNDKNYRGLIWLNSVWIPGHWRRLFKLKPGTKTPILPKEIDEKRIGKDKDGNEVIPGATWVDEHIKGDGPLISRVWADDSNRKNPRYDDKSLKRGAEHELEHTTNLNVATKIATDHLLEDPEYYEKLDIAMEGNPVQDLPGGMPEKVYRKKTEGYLKYLDQWWSPHSEEGIPFEMKLKLQELAWLIAWAGWYSIEWNISTDQEITVISFVTESDPSVGMFASRIFEVLVDRKGKVTFTPSRDYESFIESLDEYADFMEHGSLNFRIEVEKEIPARFGGTWEVK